MSNEDDEKNQAQQAGADDDEWTRVNRKRRRSWLRRTGRKWRRLARRRRHGGSGDNRVRSAVRALRVFRRVVKPGAGTTNAVYCHGLVYGAGPARNCRPCRLCMKSRLLFAEEAAGAWCCFELAAGLAPVSG